MLEISLRLFRAEGEGGFWEGVGLNPQGGMLFCSWEPMSCTPYISSSGSFSRSAHPRSLSLPYMLISFFSAAWLELEFPMGRLLLPPSVMPFPPQSLTDFLLSCLVPKTPLLLSTLYPLTPGPAQYMNFFIAGH